MTDIESTNEFKEIEFLIDDWRIGVASFDLDDNLLQIKITDDLLFCEEDLEHLERFISYIKSKNWKFKTEGEVIIDLYNSTTPSP